MTDITQRIERGEGSVTGTLDAPLQYVTEHFLLSDFICPCCDRLKIVPGFYRHVGLLERFRRELDFPVIVTSGYRCPEHNARVGGAPHSWHLLFATDVKPADGDPEKIRRMHEAAVRLGFGGIGVYEAHLHLDLRPEPLMWRG